MRRLTALVAGVMVTVALAASASASTINLEGRYRTKCVRTHASWTDRPDTYYVTREFYLREGVQYFESNGGTVKLARTGVRKFAGKALSGQWVSRFLVKVTRTDVTGNATKFEGTTTYRRYWHGERLVDEYSCKGALN